MYQIDFISIKNSLVQYFERKVILVNIKIWAGL